MLRPGVEAFRSCCVGMARRHSAVVVAFRSSGILCNQSLGRRHLQFLAYSLDLGGLLFELGCESLYLFLLLRDRCFQLLNFVIEHSLVLELGTRREVAVRYDAQVRHVAQVRYHPGSGQNPSQGGRSKGLE